MKKKSSRKNDKMERISEIKEMVHNFCDQYLNEELESYAQNLVENLGRKRKLNILRGKKEIWAAAIVYVIARINFLFDKKNKNFITHDIICNFFKTLKHTTGLKASQIQDNCKIEVGTEGYCTQDIVDSMTFYKTPEGFIIPKKWLLEKEMKVEIDPDKEEKERQFKEKQKQILQQEREEREKRISERKLEIARKKKEKEDKYQLNLFEDF